MKKNFSFKFFGLLFVLNLGTSGYAMENSGLDIDVCSREASLKALQDIRDSNPFKDEILQVQHSINVLKGKVSPLNNLDTAQNQQQVLGVVSQDEAILNQELFNLQARQESWKSAFPLSPDALGPYERWVSHIGQRPLNEAAPTVFEALQLLKHAQHGVKVKFSEGVLPAAPDRMEFSGFTLTSVYGENCHCEVSEGHHLTQAGLTEDHAEEEVATWCFVNGSSSLKDSLSHKLALLETNHPLQEKGEVASLKNKRVLGALINMDSGRDYQEYTAVDGRKQKGPISLTSGTLTFYFLTAAELHAAQVEKLHVSFWNKDK